MAATTSSLKKTKPAKEAVYVLWEEKAFPSSDE
jgi:hypothetical protein